MRLIKLSCLLLLFPCISFSQTGWEGGLQLGYANYVGDLTEPTFTFDEANLALGLNFKKQLNENLTGRLNVLIGKLSGNDAHYESLASRGNSFEGTFTEITVMGEYELLGHRRYDENGNFRSTFSPYVFLGAGITLLDPEVTYGDPDNADARTDKPAAHFTIPVGAGLKKDINEKLYLSAEWGLRIVASDYLDGVKESGDPNDNDAYFSGGISIGYRFGIKNESDIPEFD